MLGECRLGDLVALRRKKAVLFLKKRTLLSGQVEMSLA
jgi:hypothetical protein